MTQLIDLGKLRFHFAGDWVNTTIYESNDIVKYGGNVYVYTYALKTSGNLPTDTAYWALMVEGFKFKGVFSTSVSYKVGDGVAHGGKVYVSILDSTNQTPPNSTYWSLFADGIQYEGAYNGTATYQKNDVVVYGGSVYIAKQDTTNNLPTVTAYWDKFVEGVSPKSVYNVSTAYVPNDLVAYGPNIYRAKVNTTGNTPTNTTYWELFVSGVKFRGNYNHTGVTYYQNDLVNYGNSLYRCILENSTDEHPDGPSGATYWELVVPGNKWRGYWTNGVEYNIGDIVRYGAFSYINIRLTNAQLPTNTTYWSLFTSGFDYHGAWSSTHAYNIGEVVTYGGSMYQALSDNTNVNPTDIVTWVKLVPGFKNGGEWAAATSYEADTVVTHGGNSYISLLPHASVTFATDLTAGKWQKFNSGIRWRGNWTPDTAYLKDDVVKAASGSAYIAAIDHMAATDFPGDVTAGKWQTFATGSSDAFPAYTAANYGSALSIKGDGTAIEWRNPTSSDNTYYVAAHGVDSTSYGKSLAYPFKTLKYACSRAGAGATIFVKNGTYEEQLPIVVPAGVAIVGDSQRTVIITPKAGLSDDGVTPNNQSSMFLLSNGSILNKMSFTGMTGWVPGSTAADVTTSTIKGVVVRFNPDSPISTKSPYVLECAAICSGAIGALVDGSVHSTGAKTMIFHGYTVISDNGIGYWVKDGGKSEIVSCFTYYCYFGYTASGGGFIRALNGNNSYGTWGATSRGYLASETAVTGTVYGEQLMFTYTGGLINVGDTVSNGAGATATVTNVQYSSDKIYIAGRTGTFASGQSLTFTSGGTGTVLSGAVQPQSGFVLVLTGLTALPKPGASISLAGDTYSYVVLSTTGTYVNTSSKIVVVLSQEKPSGSADGTAVTIRYKYSQIRLTGHDFLSIGTGGTATTNYPGEPTQPNTPGNETDEQFPGRVFYVSTDQDGNFRVGEYFRIDQATGKATLNASAFDLSGLSSLRLGSIGAQLGETINEFSSDATMSGNSNTAIPTEYAVKTYVDGKITGLVNTAPAALDTLKELATALGNDANFSATVTTSLANKLNLSGGTMTGALTLSGAPTSNLHAATKQYVDTNKFTTGKAIAMSIVFGG